MPAYSDYYFYTGWYWQIIVPEARTTPLTGMFFWRTSRGSQLHLIHFQNPLFTPPLQCPNPLQQTNVLQIVIQTWIFLCSYRLTLKFTFANVRDVNWQYYNMFLRQLKSFILNHSTSLNPCSAKCNPLAGAMYCPLEEEEKIPVDDIHWRWANPGLLYLFLSFQTENVFASRIRAWIAVVKATSWPLDHHHLKWLLRDDQPKDGFFKSDLKKSKKYQN